MDQVGAGGQLALRPQPPGLAAGA